MKELFIDNKELILNTYIVTVFITPWVIAMIWHLRLMSAIRSEMGPVFWITIFPNQDTSKLIKSSTQLSSLQRKRNLLFLTTLVIWLIGAVFFVALLAWLNGKI